jgi:hypothetical protein
MLHSLTRAQLLPYPPGPFLVPTIFLTSFCGSFLAPGKVRSLCVTGILAYLVSLVVKYPTGSLANDALLPIQALILLTQWVDLYVLHTPEKEFRRVRDVKNENEGDVKLERTGWRAKLKWVWDLKTTVRGVGWNWSVKNIPVEAPKTKW